MTYPILTYEFDSVGPVSDDTSMLPWLNSFATFYKALKFMSE